MPGIGKRCHELRFVDARITWRIAYYIGDEAIVILEVFEKKTQTTPKRVIDIAKKRLRLYREIAE